MCHDNVCFTTLKKLLLLCVHIIRLSSAQTCLPSYHNIFTNKQSYEILGRRDFKPSGNHSGHFLPMVIDSQRNRLIIGAKDYIYYIDGITLKELYAQNWKSDDQKQSSCESTLKLTDYCSNYVHFLVTYKDKLFACGTNSLSPMYKLISLDDLSIVEEKAAYDVCSSRRDLTMVGELTELGELISGSYTDVEQKNSVISGIFVMEKGRQKLITERNKHLNHPEFIASVSVGDSVYIFLMESAAENGGAKTATVVRLCKGDNGGSNIIGPNRWTTFRKSRLQCEVSKEGEKFIFENLVHAAYDPERKVFYAAYTMFKQLNMHSAICSFKRADVDETFSGNFLSKSFDVVSNGNFLNGCNVNPANLSRNARTLNGKQPTNKLNRKALTKAMQYVLMQRKVRNIPDDYQLMLTGVSFTRIAVTQTKRGFFPVLNIGTDNGKIFMVHKNHQYASCVTKEIRTDVGPILNLLINEKEHILYISSSTNAISIRIDNCHMYPTEDLCIQGRDPICGWSRVKGRCVSIWNDLNVIQDLSECPKRISHFGQWSQWTACEFSARKYCLCRSRKCDSCNVSYCGTEPLFEVKNCSSNAVTDVMQWLEHGAIDGSWSEWSTWSTCDNKICGNKTRSKNRTCSAPKPSNGGKNCVGDSFQCQACLEKVIPINTIWSGWSNWGDCFMTKGGYIMNRTRTCSQQNACPGLDIKILPCTPEGIKWGPWSVCSCAQKVRHRTPMLINGCENNCTFMTFPQYQVCQPDPDCHALPTKLTTVADTTSAEESTKLDTTRLDTTVKKTTKHGTTEAPPSPAKDRKVISKICTPEPVQTNDFRTTNKSPIGLPTDKVVVIPIGEVRDPCASTPNRFSLQQLIIILTVVIVTCFFVCALIVYLILRRTKHTEKIVINNGRTDRIPLKKGDLTNPAT